MPRPPQTESRSTPSWRAAVSTGVPTAKRPRLPEGVKITSASSAMASPFRPFADLSKPFPVKGNVPQAAWKGQEASAAARPAGCAPDHHGDGKGGEDRDGRAREARAKEGGRHDGQGQHEVTRQCRHP